MNNIWKYSKAPLLFFCATICVCIIGKEASYSAPANKANEAAINSSSSSFADAAKTAVDRVFAKLNPKGPGACITVANADKIIYQRAFGMANVKQQISFTAGTVFDLASCSKQFTAMAIMILADRKQLSFSDDICKFFPELKPSKSRVTRVSDLLGMTSGLADYSAVFSKKQLAERNLDDVLRWTARTPRKFLPGEKWDYNNGNYALLALLIERITKQKYPDFMQEQIFVPLKMSHTQVLSHPGQKIALRSGGYTQHGNGFKWSRLDTYIYGDGQVMTTAEDFAIWDRSLRKCTLVKPATLNQAFTSGKLSNGKNTDYGFGWSVEKRDGRRVVSHEGNWDGTSTYIVRFFDPAFSVMVLSNNDCFESGSKGDIVARRIIKN